MLYVFIISDIRNQVFKGTWHIFLHPASFTFWASAFLIELLIAQPRTCLSAGHVVAEIKRKRSATASSKLTTEEVKLCRFATSATRLEKRSETQQVLLACIGHLWQLQQQRHFWLKGIACHKNWPSCPFRCTQLNKDTEPQFCCASLVRREDLMENVTHLTAAPGRCKGK